MASHERDARRARSPDPAHPAARWRRSCASSCPTRIRPWSRLSRKWSRSAATCGRSSSGRPWTRPAPGTSAPTLPAPVAGAPASSRVHDADGGDPQRGAAPSARLLPLCRLSAGVLPAGSAAAVGAGRAQRRGAGAGRPVCRLRLGAQGGGRAGVRDRDPALAAQRAAGGGRGGERAGGRVGGAGAAAVYPSGGAPGAAGPGSCTPPWTGCMCSIGREWEEAKVGEVYQRGADGGVARISLLCDAGRLQSGSGGGCGRWRRRRGSTTARARALLGDGAEWIWQEGAKHFPRTTEIVDLFHVLEYLWARGPRPLPGGSGGQGVGGRAEAAAAEERGQGGDRGGGGAGSRRTARGPS